jgi:putative transposase
MHTAIPIDRYKYHRFPAEIISYGTWLYVRFCLSYCDVEELLSARGIIATDEGTRQRCVKFGQPYANQKRCRGSRPGDTWQWRKCL